MTIPSQQTRLPKFLADNDRGERCLDPKLKKKVHPINSSFWVALII